MLSKTELEQDIPAFSWLSWSSFDYLCGELCFWVVDLGDEDFLLVWGDTSRPGDDTLPERSSDVTDRLALWELSERSLQ